MWTRTLAALGAVSLAVVAAGSCALDVDKFHFEGTAAGIGGSGGNGTGGSGSECTQPTDCTTEDTDCQTPTCAAGFCGVDLEAAGTACDDEPEGNVCDGDGSCVECLTEAQCGANELCEAQKCIPAACQNEQIDPGETDVDCGGPDCNPCANGKDCLLPTDCISQFCNSNECAPCQGHVECPDGRYCDMATGLCEPKKELGDPCTNSPMCSSGHCPSQDDVCCDAPCTAECRACVQSKSGTADGTCADVPAESDPDSECGDASSCEGNACDGSGDCTALTSGEVCVAQSCSSGTQYYADTCNASGQCEDGGSISCGAYACVGDHCVPACLDHDHCHPDYWCNDPGGGVCDPDKGLGEWCSAPEMCESNHCVDSLCCDGPCAGLCESCKGMITNDGVDGQCDFIKEQHDPINECFGDTYCCDGSGQCGDYASCI